MKSAGILLYRFRDGALEVLLAHPGGPFWAKKDDGAWTIPKGEIGDAEEPLVAARRELLEETGLEVEPGAFLGAWLDPYDGRTILGLTYEALAPAGEPVAADDVAELQWFAPDELPGAEEFAFSSHPEVVSLWRRRHEHP